MVFDDYAIRVELELDRVVVGVLVEIGYGAT